LPPINLRILSLVKIDLLKSHNQRLRRRPLLLRRSQRLRKPKRLPNQLRLKRKRLSQQLPHQHQNPRKKKNQNKKMLRSQKPRWRLLPRWGLLPSQRQRRKIRRSRIRSLKLPRQNKRSQRNSQKPKTKLIHQPSNNRRKNLSRNLMRLKKCTRLIRRSTTTTGIITARIEVADNHNSS